jgi:CHAT domain-containing protein/tetratricopeptide (TPR) repeat protein
MVFHARPLTGRTVRFPRITRPIGSPRSRTLLYLIVAGVLGWSAAGNGQHTVPHRAALLEAQADTAAKRLEAPKLRRAVTLYLEAAGLYRRAGQARQEAKVLHATAKAYHALGQVDSAFICARRALALRKTSGDRAGEALSLRQIGVFFLIQGLPDSALSYYHHALAIGPSTGSRSGEGDALNYIAVAYLSLGRLDSARIYYGRAREVSHEARYSEGEREALNGIGKVYRAEGRLDSALVYFRKVLAAKAEAGVLNNIALVFYAIGITDSTLAYYHRSLESSRGRHNDASQGHALNGIAKVHQNLGHLDTARAYYERALAIRRDIGSRATEGETLADLGSLYLRERDPARAAAYFDSAAAVVAGVRHAAGSDANGVSYGELVRQLFSNWVLAWLARAREVGTAASARGALGAAERGRAQALVALMQRSTPQGTGTAAAGEAITRAGGDLVAEAGSLVGWLGRTRTAALSYLVTADTLVTWLVLPSGRIHIARTAVRSDSLAGLVETLRSELDPGRALTAAGREGGRGKARVALGVLKIPSTAFVAVEPRRLVVRREAQSGLSRLAAVVLPQELVTRLQVELPDGGDLVIVPHGALSLIPFGALPVGRSGTPLGLRYAVRFAPSLTALRGAEARSGPPSGLARRGVFARALVVGNPTMPPLPGFTRRDTLEALPGTEREARWVAGRLGARALIGPAATETAVAARLARAPLVHLATHALAYNSDAKARDSFVALASDAANDGLLTVGEVLDDLADPALAFTAELVVLSACETGLGQMREAEGTVGLARAFLARGARSVLVSLWNVSDEATQRLMDRFYAHWLEDGDHPSKAEALRRAQDDVRKTRGFESPVYWAAFQLVGAR